MVEENPMETKIKELEKTVTEKTEEIERLEKEAEQQKAAIRELKNRLAYTTRWANKR